MPGHGRAGLSLPGWGLPSMAGRGGSLLGPGVVGAGVGCHYLGNAGWEIFFVLTLVLVFLSVWLTFALNHKNN